MNTVFLVQHLYDLENNEEVKFVGVYSSLEKAQQAIERLRLLPGFMEKPEGFNIDEYTLNQDHWTEGFVTITSVEVPDIMGKWKTVQATELPDGNYQIIEYYENDQLGNYQNGDIVRVEEREGNLYAIEKIR